MGPIEALELALSKEIEAAELYKTLANDYSLARDTFLYLAGEERKHQKIIEKKILDLSR